MATPSSILSWEIPCTEKPGALQSMRWQRVRHDLATKQHDNMQLNSILLSLKCKSKCSNKEKQNEDKAKPLWEQKF